MTKNSKEKFNPDDNLDDKPSVAVGAYLVKTSLAMRKDFTTENPIISDIGKKAWEANKDHYTVRECLRREQQLTTSINSYIERLLNAKEDSDENFELSVKMFEIYQQLQDIDLDYYTAVFKAQEIPVPPPPAELAEIKIALDREEAKRAQQSLPPELENAEGDALKTYMDKESAKSDELKKRQNELQETYRQTLIDTLQKHYKPWYHITPMQQNIIAIILILLFIVYTFRDYLF